MIGQTVSHYKILEKLGEGGMGVVYKAQDLKLDRTVALKFLPTQFGSEEEQKKRFFQEAKAASALDHPNVCTIHEIDQTAEGQTFICMAYYEGEPLNKKLERGYLTLEEVLDFGLQIAQGLAKAHQIGIIHRDIKPGNIIITEEGLAKILDFGLAKLVGKSSVTTSQKVIGTTGYMSPEQLCGETVDQRTDIWSLGMVLYEMSAGQPPFSGESEQAIMYAILNDAPLPITNIRAGLFEEIDRMVRKCLEKKPSFRYQFVNDLIVDLRRLQKDKTPSVGVSAAPPKSIAVLPFDNISPDPENEYFSDGLTEEIITNLSKVRTLKVISRTSIMRYKGVKKPVKQIAGELGVQFILEGSVRKQGNDLRISAQLIDAAQDAHLWAERYRGTVEDIFDIQEKVAGEITGALKLHLTPSEEKDLKKRYTENTEAYQLYLQGRYFWNKRTEEGMKKGIAFFRQAIEKAPAYAPAYVGLADAHILLGVYGYLPSIEVMPAARAAALTALEIDNTLAEAHASLAHVKMLYEWDWEGAEREFLQAIQLNPGYAPARLWYSLNLSSMGRLEEALAEIRHARELDPLSLIINTDVGLIHYFARRYDQAIEEYQKTLEIDRNFFVVRAALGLAYEQTGRYPEAIAELQQALTLSGGSTLMVAALGHALAAAGRRGEAQEILKKLEETSKERYVSPYSVARIYAALGETDLAFDWLEQGYKQRSLFLIHAPLKVDPAFDFLRSDPRFTELLKKVGLEK